MSCEEFEFKLKKFYYECFPYYREHPEAKVTFGRAQRKYIKSFYEDNERYISRNLGISHFIKEMANILEGFVA